VLAALGLMRGGLPGIAMAGRLYRGMTGHCSLYEAIGADTADDAHGASDSVPAQAGVHVVESMTIERAPEDRFMKDITSATASDPSRKTSHGVATGPMGKTIEWDAEIHNETPGSLIAWRSTGGDIDVAGSVHFTPAPGVRLDDAPGGCRTIHDQQDKCFKIVLRP